ncbi:MAG: trypsin-like peptidase domain-containing protein [Desulfurococcaceae archaeon]|nr:trypsin-like peptidase domain-containing protein [Desulfurococcaceae archaeon]
MSIRDLSFEIVNVVKKVKPSVVTISTEIPHPLEFFGYEPVRGYGSGFVIAPGYAITNAHVVRGASRVNVLFSDGYLSSARVVASDPVRDLALLKTEEHGTPLKLGDSDKLEVGEIVLAIGSPLGLLENSVSMGVISAVGRTIVSRDIVLEDVIQTDAAINPGNSGGPLVNLEGEAIGVTTAIIPFAQGIGFAIPINTVKRFVEMIIKYGRPVRAWIGVYVAPLNPTMAALYKLPVTEGLLIARVIPGSPADAGGLVEGDIIIKADEKSVKRVAELREIIERDIDRGYIILEVIRAGRRFTAKIGIIVEEI